MNKNILVIENENIDDDIRRFVSTLEDENSKTYIFEHLRFIPKNVEKLKECLKTVVITDIIFKTTWLYKDITFELYKLISKLPQSLNIWSLTDNSVSCNILSSISINTRQEYNNYISMQRHNIYNYCMVEPIKEEWILNDVILDEFLEKIEQKEYEQESIEKEKSLLKAELESIMKFPTKEYVQIVDIKDFGSEWSNLKKDDIVPILKTPSTDSSPLWGVWVAGKTEPVKLLNSDFQQEYIYLGIKKENEQFKLTANGIAKEIVSCVRNTGLNRNSMIAMLTVKINRKLDFENDDTLHSWITREILDFANVPRRFYRNHFKNQLEKYYKNHTYFREFDRYEEQKYIQII